MQQLSYAIRCKPDWVIKYKDAEIRSKWRKEALEQQAGEGELTGDMVDYVLDELAMHERDLKDPLGIRVSLRRILSVRSIVEVARAHH
jgi:hypothetical protein